MSDTDAYAAAKRRAEAKYGFYIHLTVYAAVMVLLLVINLITSADSLWFVWPLLGWGLAVLLHGLRVFVLADRSEIIDSMTRRELDKPGGRAS